MAGVACFFFLTLAQGGWPCGGVTAPPFWPLTSFPPANSWASRFLVDHHSSRLESVCLIFFFLTLWLFFLPRYRIRFMSFPSFCHWYFDLFRRFFFPFRVVDLLSYDDGCCYHFFSLDCSLWGPCHPDLRPWSFASTKSWWYDKFLAKEQRSSRYPVFVFENCICLSWWFSFRSSS